MSTGNENVFISWSGEQSKVAASALRTWLRRVVQSARPWMPEKDIEKGSRGLHEVSKALEGMRVAIVCLTPENLSAPWILYEAGALSKAIGEETRLCTYLLGGLQVRDVKPPLSMFQATRADKEDTRKLVHVINLAVGEDPLPEVDLDCAFDAMWPQLEPHLRVLPASTPAVQERPAGEVLEELVALVRQQSAQQNLPSSSDLIIQNYMVEIRNALSNVGFNLSSLLQPGVQIDRGKGVHIGLGTRSEIPPVSLPRTPVGLKSLEPLNPKKL